jgi:hypothetical protein
VPEGLLREVNWNWSIVPKDKSCCEIAPGRVSKLKGESECQVKQGEAEEEIEQKCDVTFVEARKAGTGKGGNKTERAILLHIRNLEHLGMAPGYRHAHQAQAGTRANHGAP